MAYWKNPEDRLRGLLPPAPGYEFDNQWYVHPDYSESWDCPHKGMSVERGHTSLYTIYLLDLDSEESRVQYIGVTGNLRRRFTQHRRDKPWWGHSELCFVECYATFKQALVAEAAEIRALNPIQNIAGKALA